MPPTLIRLKASLENLRHLELLSSFGILPSLIWSTPLKTFHSPSTSWKCGKSTEIWAWKSGTFRNVLRDKLLSLLEQQRVYWKQRGSVKWVTLGDAGTKFFHANATTKHRRNSISKLMTEDGQLVTSHKDKELQIWQSFKERLGIFEYGVMHFDLSSLIQEHHSLNWLEEQFTSNEIDEVAKNLPNDKSPGPDGFTNEFIKKCWPIIKNDFYELCWAFQNNNVCLQSINASFITIIPKKSKSLFHLGLQAYFTSEHLY